MGSVATRKIDGFVSLGGEVPYLDPTRVMIVGIDVPETPDNWFAHCPRVNDETDGDLEPYVLHILSGGKTDPIDVYRDGDRLVILDGRRTTRAARIARSRQAAAKVAVTERATVRALVHKGPEDDLFRINAESHNQRPLTTTQRAKMILSYYNRVGENLEKTAAFFRVTKPTISSAIAIFDLDKSLQKAIDEGLPASRAVKLAKLPREEQRKALADLRSSGSTRGAALDNGVSKASNGEKVGAADATRARPKKLLARWSVELRKDGYVELAETIDFVLGGPEMAAVGKDAKLRETLERSGFKSRTDDAEGGSTGS